MVDLSMANCKITRWMVYSSLWLAIYQWVYLSSATVYEMYCNVVSVLHLWYWIFYYSIYRSVSIALIVSILHCILVPVCTALHCICGVLLCRVTCSYLLVGLSSSMRLSIYLWIDPCIELSMYALVASGKRANITNWKTTMLLMGKSTISTGPFSSSQTVTNYQRVPPSISSGYLT